MKKKAFYLFAFGFRLIFFLLFLITSFKYYTFNIGITCKRDLFYSNEGSSLLDSLTSFLFFIYILVDLHFFT